MHAQRRVDARSTSTGRTTRARTPGAVPGRDETAQRHRRDRSGSRSTSTVVVDLKGFSQLIDAMGGVDDQRQAERLRHQAADRRRAATATAASSASRATSSPGASTSTATRRSGTPAPAAADSDTFRQVRQRCVVQAIVKQVDPAQMVSKYPEIASIAQRQHLHRHPGPEPASVRRPRSSGSRRRQDQQRRADARSQDFNSARPDYDADPRLRSRTGIAPPKADDLPSTSTRHEDPDEDPVSDERRPTTSADRAADLRQHDRTQQSPRPMAGGFVTNDCLGVARCC